MPSQRPEVRSMFMSFLSSAFDHLVGSKNSLVGSCQALEGAVSDEIIDVHTVCRVSAFDQTLLIPQKMYTSQSCDFQPHLMKRQYPHRKQRYRVRLTITIVQTAFQCTARYSTPVAAAAREWPAHHRPRHTHSDTMPDRLLPQWFR